MLPPLTSWRTLACLLLVVLPVQAQEVRLPAEISAGIGSWVIVAPEVISGGKAKFRIDPGLQEVRLDLLFPPEVANQARGKVLTATVAGRYKVECWNAKADVPSDIAVCWVTVGTPGPVPVPPGPVPPSPPPEPPPPNPLPAGPRQVLILRESADDTPAMSRLIISLQAGKGRDYLKSKGHACFVLDVDANGPDGEPDRNVVKWVGAVKLLPPWVAILDKEGNVLAKQNLSLSSSTVDEVLTLLKKHEAAQ